MNINEKLSFSELFTGKTYEDGGIIEDNDYFRVVNHFFYFAMNYDSNFIGKVWADKGEMSIKHFKDKFANAYEKVGSAGAMLKFWAELDTDNRKRLSKWIKENYKGAKLEKGGKSEDVLNTIVGYLDRYEKSKGKPYYRECQDYLEKVSDETLENGGNGENIRLNLKEASEFIDNNHSEQPVEAIEHEPGWYSNRTTISFKNLCDKMSEDEIEFNNEDKYLEKGGSMAVGGEINTLEQSKDYINNASTEETNVELQEVTHPVKYVVLETWNNTPSIELLETDEDLISWAKYMQRTGEYHPQVAGKWAKGGTMRCGRRKSK